MKYTKKYPIHPLPDKQFSGASIFGEGGNLPSIKDNTHVVTKKPKEELSEEGKQWAANEWNKKLEQRKKELSDYYSKEGMFSVMKKPVNIDEFAEKSLRYNESPTSEKLKTAAIDVTLGVAPELLLSKFGKVPQTKQWYDTYHKGTLTNKIPTTPEAIIAALAFPAAKTGSKLANFAMDAVTGSMDVGLLSKAYKINPWAFKPNPEAYYRGIGKEGVDDILESKIIRSKKQHAYPEPYFSKGVIGDKYAKGYFAELTNEPMKGVGSFKTGDLIQTPINTVSINNPNLTLYKKDWLRGYKPIEIPESKIYNKFSNSNFKSEINWSKWNPEIPDNTKLMQEYNTIEKTSKANGTWMKNPDGSPFQGTPEQFVQQNSENFKKAFPEYHGEILNHNTNAELNTIDESFFNKGAGDTGYYGKGTYAHPKKEYTKVYGKNNYELYLNSKNKGFLDKSNIDDAEYFKRSDNEILQHHLPEYENKLMNYKLDPSRYYDNAKENWLNKLNEQVKAGKISRDKLDEFTSLHNPKNGEVVIPFNNRVKSAIGNNGMFDMTNPNIYKGLVPAVIGTAALANEKKYGGWLDNYK